MTSSQGIARVPWWRRAGRSFCSYTFAGTLGALVFALLSLTPSLLPRPSLFQGLVTGVTAAIGYGLAVGTAWVWRAYANREARRASTRAWQIVAGIATVLVAAGTIASVSEQNTIRRLMGMKETSIWESFIVAILAVVIFALLVGFGRLLRTATRGLNSLLSRRIGPLAARATSAVVVSIVTFMLLSGVVYNNMIETIDRSFAAGDQAISASLTPPSSPLRSGSPDSVLKWDDLGRQGRRFVARGPSANKISELTGRPAVEPIRIYSGTSNSQDVEERARLAVEDLQRAGGFERPYLLVAGTTGSGFLEPSSVDTFEYMTGGDSAIVSMQYSHLPSWVSFLVDQTAARRAGRALFDAVYQVWTKLPTDSRPKLYLFGESLGSFSMETAFSGEADLANRVSGGLFVGPPAFNTLYTEFRTDRDAGSQEVNPIYRDGRIVRFTNDPSQLAAPADLPWDGPHILYMVQPSDPITWWSPDLIWHEPDWLNERRGADVSPAFRWYPIVTFWQTAADMAVGMAVPAGHGHNFVGQHVDGWRQVLGTEWWTDAMSHSLRTDILKDHAARAGIPPSMQDS